ncbi:antitoxin family protein [Thermococcus sp.]
MERVVKGVYMHGEIILLDDVHPKEGERLIVEIASREEMIKRLAGRLGKGNPEDVERYIGEMIDEGSP